MLVEGVFKELTFTVQKPTYYEDMQRIYVNKEQYFEGVTKEVWEYEIGGYQVLSQWLKYRKGRSLSFEDIKHYCKITTALKKTIEIQDEIDTIYADVEKFTIDSIEKKQDASLEQSKK